MSFDNFDLQARATPAGSMRGNEQSRHSDSWESLRDSINLQIFKVNSNVQGMNRLIDKIGTVNDGVALRKSLANLTDSTRKMIEWSGRDIQRWAALVPETTSGEDRSTQQKVAKEISTAILSFQRAQKLSAEKLKHQVVKEEQKLAGKIASDGQGLEDEYLEDEPAEHQQQHLQRRQQMTTSATAAFQESMIAERESEIQEIETGIHELNDIFHDLNKLVGEQGDMIDNIESNVLSVEADTRSAGDELNVAHEYQRRAGRRMICLLLVMVIVITIVLLAILS
ncbi:hypothetical protein NliqN6_1008 [Naganishia liquefaciens]|uniref:t-SNARE coiled-coil homology domain-containing protein n=1 Tax=Naganishia liquefaciens TaxID=104408 RepID=A0A8H3TPM2_9TREE|nr:hypothetical protein NliqN6_1008 [Naganishia liquefaciens]